MFPALMMILASTVQTDVRARLDLDPLQAEIGQPVTVVLTVSHPRDVEIEFPEDDQIAPDDSWVFLDSLGQLTTKDPEAPERSISFARWQVTSLEPGERTFAFADVRWSNSPAAGFASIEAPTLTVGAALAEGEDVPRPPRGFRNPELPSIGSSPALWFIGGSVLLVIVMILILRRKSAGTTAQVAAVSPRERLDALSEDDRPDDVRPLYFELSKLVREICDRAIGDPDEPGDPGQSGEGKTDEEWIASVRGRDDLPPELVDELGELFGRCEAVKYGGSAPTKWAFDEALASARSLATRVEERATKKETAA